MKQSFPGYREFAATYPAPEGASRWQKAKHKTKTVLGYAMVVFGLIAVYSILASAQRQPEYYDRKKYKRVIKQGVLFTTVEYHER